MLFRSHREDGPYQWANARLVRYADDFVILAKYAGRRIEQFAEQTLQEWMGLHMNRDKTRTVRLHEPGTGLNFLGYTFRWKSACKRDPRREEKIGIENGPTAVISVG